MVETNPKIDVNPHGVMDKCLKDETVKSHLINTDTVKPQYFLFTTK